MNVIGHPGAGYIVRGTDKVTFAEAATTSLRSTADLVLVFGSRNDGKQNPATMAAAATDLYTKIRERAPHAKLIVVGPAWVDENVPDFIISDSKAISERSVRRRLQFVNPLSERWFFGADAKLIGADGVHPTDAGHQYLAEKMYALDFQDPGHHGYPLGCIVPSRDILFPEPLPDHGRAAGARP